jgi:hypothetical protein
MEYSNHVQSLHQYLPISRQSVFLLHTYFVSFLQRKLRVIPETTLYRHIGRYAGVGVDADSGARAVDSQEDHAEAGGGRLLPAGPGRHDRHQHHRHVRGELQDVLRPVVGLWLPAVPRAPTF